MTAKLLICTASKINRNINQPNLQFGSALMDDIFTQAIYYGGHYYDYLQLTK